MLLRSLYDAKTKNTEYIKATKRAAVCVGCVFVRRKHLTTKLMKSVEAAGLWTNSKEVAHILLVWLLFSTEQNANNILQNYAEEHLVPNHEILLLLVTSCIIYSS